MNWVLLKNSLFVSGVATVSAVTLGLVVALWVACLSRPLQKFCIGLAIATLAIPHFVFANCWLFLLSPSGAWRQWLPLEVMSLGGASWVLSLMLWPVTLLFVLGSWHRLQPAFFENDTAVRGRFLVFNLMVPTAQGALTQAGVITFILALNNFAVPALLQVKVFPAELWVRFSTNLNATAALLLSWPLVAAPLIMLVWYSRQAVSWPQLESRVPPWFLRQQLGLPLRLTSGAVAAALCVCSTLLPIAQLVGSRRVWSELGAAIAAGQTAIWWSVFFATLAASMVLLLALLFGRSGDKSRPNTLCALLWLPFLVPGVMLGILFISLFNRSWSSLFYGSAGIVVLAFVVRFLAPGFTLVSHARKLLDPALVDVARLEGASRLQLLRLVEWFQFAPQVASAWYIVFLLCLWDVELILLLVPPGVETLSLRIFNLLHYGHNPQVDALCLVLLVIALLPLLLWTALGWSRQLLVRCMPTPQSSRVFAMLLGLSCATAVLLAGGCSPSPNGGTPLESELFASVRCFGARGAGVGQFNKPRSVAVDARDNFYVVDMTGRVQKFTSNGVFVLSWQMPETDLGKPKGMCRDNAGNIVVIEPHYARVNHFTPEGLLVSQWGTRGTNAGLLSVPRGIAVTAGDEIFICEYQQAERVQKFVWSKEEQRRGVPPKWVLSFGTAGPGRAEFNRPEGLCVDRKGSVYVADSCNHRIQVFSAEGQCLRTYGRPGRGPGELSYPYDICVDAAGLQYVCEFGNSRIQVFDPEGRSLEIIGGPGAEPGRFSNPWSVALDSTGNLYVADSQNHRVQKLMRNGKLTKTMKQSAPRMGAALPPTAAFSLLLTAS